MPKEKKRKEFDIHCQFSEMRDVVNMQPHPQNPNKHPDRQIALLAGILRFQGWRSPIQVSQRSGFIVAGHGRLEAAKLGGLQEVPIDLQDFPDEASELAHMLADNRISELSGVDMDEMSEILQRAANEMEDFDLQLAGYSEKDFQDLMDSVEVIEMGEGDIGKTAEDKEAGFEEADIRQVTIIMTLEQHRECLPRLAKIMKACKLNTNSDAALYAVMNYDIPAIEG